MIEKIPIFASSRMPNRELTNWLQESTLNQVSTAPVKAMMTMDTSPTRTSPLGNPWEA